MPQLTTTGTARLRDHSLNSPAHMLHAGECFAGHSRVVSEYGSCRRVRRCDGNLVEVFPHAWRNLPVIAGHIATRTTMDGNAAMNRPSTNLNPLVCNNRSNSATERSRPPVAKSRCNSQSAPVLLPSGCPSCRRSSCATSSKCPAQSIWNRASARPTSSSTCSKMAPRIRAPHPPMSTGDCDEDISLAP